MRLLLLGIAGALPGEIEQVIARLDRQRAAVDALEHAQLLERVEVAAHGRFGRVQLAAQRLQIHELLRFEDLADPELALGGLHLLAPRPFSAAITASVTCWTMRSAS